MVYQIGTASNTFDLFEKLTSFMTMVPGWQMWSNIDGYDHSDFVYYSTGNNGRNDIYIRQCIGQPELFIKGADQYDYGSGDSGYLNFFSYLSFTQEGDAYSGASEIGSFGPRVLFWNGNSSDFKLYHQHFLTQRSGGSPHVIYGTVTGGESPPSTIEDEHCVVRRYWSEMNDAPGYTSNPNKSFATDGKGNLYIGEYSNNKIYKYSLSRGGGKIDSNGEITVGEELSSPGFSPVFLVYAEDRTTRIPYLYCFGPLSTNGVRYNLITLASETLPDFYWPTRSGVLGVPTNTIQSSGAICWDGGRYLYIIRGGQDGGVNPSANFPDWGRYDILTNDFVSTDDPEDTSFKDITANSGTGIGPGQRDLIFVDKNISGFDYHRLYLGVVSDGLWYINIDYDTHLATVSDPYWHRQSQVHTLNFLSQYVVNRNRRLFRFPMEDVNAPYGIYESVSPIADRNVFYSDLKEEETLMWNAAGPAYSPTGQASYGKYELIDGYGCRVRASIDATTDYVFIGNEDRIIVATKSRPSRDEVYDATWSIAYMGAFDSEFDAEPYAEFLEDISAGKSKVIKLKNRVGSFNDNTNYVVVGTSGPFENKYYKIDGRTKIIGNSELITVTKAHDDYVIATLRNNYKAGTKISLDPQPVCLFFDELEKVQTTCSPQKLTIDYADITNGSDDSSRNIYNVILDETSIKTLVSGCVTNNYDIPVDTLKFGCAESEGDHVINEIGGSLIGMYMIGKNSSIQSGQIININGSGYMIIDIPSYTNKYIAIGPLEN